MEGVKTFEASFNNLVILSFLLLYNELYIYANFEGLEEDWPSQPRVAR